MNQPLLETLKQALDDFEYYACDPSNDGDRARRQMQILVAAIKQLEKAEPVGLFFKSRGVWHQHTGECDDELIPLYTHPAAPGEKK